MKSSQEQQTWRNRLRELYLTKIPNEDDAVTRSITFRWAKFSIEPKAKEIEFYLTTKDSIEDFIDELLSSIAKEIEQEKKFRVYQYSPDLVPSACEDISIIEGLDIALTIINKHREKGHNEDSINN
jgi:hypothetical protein